MDANDILAQLPARLDWMVFFRLAAIRPLADRETIRRMFFLGDEVDPDRCSHVVLTSEGRWVAPTGGERLIASGDPAPRPRDVGDASLAERFADQLTDLSPDAADCLGVGCMPGQEPVILQVRVDGRIGEALALFDHQPSQQHYDLLPAVGVDFIGSEPRGNRVLARFRNQLPFHLKAGQLSGFARTAHCNDFFLNHGEIDERLLEGMLAASRDRVESGRRIAQRTLERLATAGESRPLPMRCDPPGAAAPIPMGDLVPLGFLLWAFEHVPPPEPLAPLDAFGRRLLIDALRQRLLDARQDGLWAFHSGRLVTATDSALVLIGVTDPQSIEALERFTDGQGAYVPQEFAPHPRPGAMMQDTTNAHWCQPDFATTCLVRALRARAGLPRRTPAAFLDVGFEWRSGLFFANPYLTDLCFALATAGDPDCAGVRARLLDEVLASANPDGSFGTFDPALSTALATVVLGELGYRGRSVRVAQLRLLEQLEMVETWPVSTPFYSTFRTPADEARELEQEALPAQYVRAAGELHEVSLYRDVHHVILGSLTALALSVACDPERPDLEARRAHPRYRCQHLEDYIASWALPPYLTPSHLMRPWQHR